MITMFRLLILRDTRWGLDIEFLEDFFFSYITLVICVL